MLAHLQLPVQMIEQRTLAGHQIFKRKLVILVTALLTGGIVITVKIAVPIAQGLLTRLNLLERLSARHGVVGQFRLHSFKKRLPFTDVTRFGCFLKNRIFFKLLTNQLL